MGAPRELSADAPLFSLSLSLLLSLSGDSLSLWGFAREQQEEGETFPVLSRLCFVTRREKEIPGWGRPHAGWRVRVVLRHMCRPRRGQDGRGGSSARRVSRPYIGGFLESPMPDSRLTLCWTMRPFCQK